jgi:hypothetical protein
VRTIKVNAEVFDRIKAFAAFYDMPVEAAMNRALKEWMDATGDIIMANTEHKRRQTSTPKLFLVKRSAGIKTQR